MKRYYHRTIEPVLKKAIEQFPAVVLTGPRQSGKTTLLRELYGSKYRYISLEPPDVRASATADPRGFMELYSDPVIFDEIQYAPELLFYIKEAIDEKRDENGRFILTGSQNLLLMNQVAESLAGRTAMLGILPLSYAEMEGNPGKKFIWNRGKNHGSISDNWWEVMLRGGYPELIRYPDKDSSLWYASYIQTYLERDVRVLKQVGDLTLFQTFLKVLAARSAQLLNISDVARDIGMSVNAVKSWIGVLEATHQIIILRPYYANLNKRLVKTPKIYFSDVGVLCYLAGIKDPEYLFSGPMAGAVFETFVVSEIYKRLMGQGKQPSLYFWRTAAGVEVDLLVEEQTALIPIEIKSTSTPKPAMGKSILQLKNDLPDKVQDGYVVHLGSQLLPLAKGVKALPFSQL